MPMTTENKVMARTLIRMVDKIASDDAEAADMSAAFDGGEFSARFHGPGSKHANESIRLLLVQLNLTATEAQQVLMDFCWNYEGHQTPPAYETSMWISAAFEETTV